MLTPGEVRVLGLGNVLMGDDAFGPWVIEELLASWQFPDGVRLLDVGTPGLDLTPYLADADTVLLLDTVRADAPAGTIRVCSREQLLARPPEPRLSQHDPGVADALLALDCAGGAPRDVILIGVVPGRVAKGIGLTPAVQEAVARAASEVVERLEGLGLAPHRQAPAWPAAPWWERPRSGCSHPAPRVRRQSRAAPVARAATISGHRVPSSGRGARSLLRNRRRRRAPRERSAKGAARGAVEATSGRADPRRRSRAAPAARSDGYFSPRSARTFGSLSSMARIW
jgi:hydrogenase maturation protease